MQKKVAVIGAGFSGLTAACYLAKGNYKVTVVDKLKEVGGRAQVLRRDGFTFDMGPSWYWMPEVFEDFFNDFGHSVNQYYKLERLDPGYRVFFGKQDFIDIPADWQELVTLFESLEAGSTSKLEAFMNAARQKYEIAMGSYIQKPGLSPFEFFDFQSLKYASKLDLVKSIKKLVAKHFKHPKIRSILEFPVLFLGALPKDIPGLYTLMNYADLKLGTWYPAGGMGEIPKAMKAVAEEIGVEFRLNTNVESIVVEGKEASGLKVHDKVEGFDIILGSADYHHVDQKLLPTKYRNYSPKYWDKRVLAPSALLYYIALDKKVDSLLHHNLFFDEDFEKHGKEIYDDPKWPEKPQMYVSVASRTDDSIAPKGKDALVGLIPVAVGLKDTPEIRKAYEEKLIDKIEMLTGERIREHVLFVESYAQSNFINDYNSFKGNAYGLANTLKQTAFLKPKIRNTKLSNLFYAGQLTVPGAGVPPAILSGKIVAKEIQKTFK